MVNLFPFFKENKHGSLHELTHSCFVNGIGNKQFFCSLKFSSIKYSQC